MARRQTHCHNVLSAARMPQLYQVIYHVNDHTDGWSDDDLKGSVRGDSLPKRLVPLRPLYDEMHPRVTFKPS